MDVASLVVNIFIALGTIGAASVALWLGIQAQRASIGQAREARQKLTRQVIAIYHPPYGESSPSVEVINASQEVITRVMVHVSVSIYPEPEDPSDQLAWDWEDKIPTSDFSNIGYLLPAANAILHGRFRRGQPDVSAEPGTPDPRPFVDDVTPYDVDLELIWEDSYGDVWNKGRGEAAFPTSWAAPWRDLRNRVPSWLQPAHWPPKATMHQRPPLRARLGRGVQRIKNRISRIGKRSE